MPIAPSKPGSIREVHGRSLYLLYVLAIASSLVGSIAIAVLNRTYSAPLWALVAIAIVAASPFMLSAFLFWRMLRTGLDELGQRIVLEGMAFALTVYLPLSALLHLLRMTGVFILRLDAPDLLLTPALLVAIGIAIAKRRYS